jgi:hypothetical protein
VVLLKAGVVLAGVVLALLHSHQTPAMSWQE